MSSQGSVLQRENTTPPAQRRPGFVSPSALKKVRRKHEGVCGSSNIQRHSSVLRNVDEMLRAASDVVGMKRHLHDVFITWCLQICWRAWAKPPTTAWEGNTSTRGRWCPARASHFQPVGPPSSRSSDVLFKGYQRRRGRATPEGVRVALWASLKSFTPKIEINGAKTT